MPLGAVIGSIVDPPNPWLSPGEFLIDKSGTIRVSYAYQHCENYPEHRIFLTAAKLF